MELEKIAKTVRDVAGDLGGVQDALTERLQPLFDQLERLPPIFEAPSRALASVLGNMPQQPEDIDLQDPMLARAMIVIALAPLIWNLVARFEYRTRLLSKIFLKKYIACYALALWIFCFSLFRDKTFMEAIASQPQSKVLDSDEFLALAGFLFLFGVVLVVTAYARLGIAGTYLGDYFGILFEEKIEGFPFTVTDHPMYDGSSMLFFAKAILSRSMAGILLSCWVYIVYRIASVYEGEFTNFIYTEAAKQKASTQNMSAKKASPASISSTSSTPKKQKKPSASEAKPRSTPTKSQNKPTASETSSMVLRSSGKRS